MDSDLIRAKRLCHQSSVTNQGSESTNIFHSLMNSSSLRLPVTVLVIALGFYFVNIRLYPIIVDAIDVFRWCFIPVTTLYLTSSRFRAVVGLLHSICVDMSLESAQSRLVALLSTQRRHAAWSKPNRTAAVAEYKRHTRKASVNSVPGCAPSIPLYSLRKNILCQNRTDQPSAPLQKDSAPSNKPMFLKKWP